MQFGRYYEEFDVGATYKHWPGKTITEADDHLFCLLTMNHHPLHTDAHYAETKTEFKRNVVVGNLVYSLALGMSVADISGKAIANLEVESLKHENPTFHGDTIYAETTVLDKRESSSKPDRGIITVETRAFNQRGERVCIFKRRVMVPKREAGELQPADIPAGERELTWAREAPRSPLATACAHCCPVPPTRSATPCSPGGLRREAHRARAARRRRSARASRAEL